MTKVISEGLDVEPSEEWISAMLDGVELEQMAKNWDSAMFPRSIEKVCTIWQSQPNIV